MPLPTRKIVGQAVYGDNTGASGRLRFSPEFLVAYNGVVVLPSPVTVIAGNGGSFEVELATTDAAGYAPADWVWQVEELWPGGRTFFFELPTEDGSDVSYTSLIPATSIADPYAAHTHPELGGLPIGGDTGQLVVKQSNATGDVAWETLTASDVGALPDGAQLNDLSDVTAPTPATSDLLTWDGAAWVPSDAPTVDAIQFDTAAAEGEPGTGQMVWNVDEGTIDLGLNGVNQTFIHLGQEMMYRVENQTAAPLEKGALVGFAGTVGSSGKLLVRLYDASAHPAKTVMGIAAATIPVGEQGYVVAFGKVRKVNTDVVGWEESDLLYADPATPGGLTNVAPQAPDAIVTVAALVTKSEQVGELFVRPTFAPSLEETQDVLVTAPSSGQVLVYDVVSGLWENATLTASDVGAYPDSNPDGFVDAAGAASAAPVQSVNTQTGAVVLDATDVGAYPDTNPSNYIDAAGAPVQSVNTATGAVVLGAADVGAAPVRATLNAQTSTTYTLALTDENSLVTLANAAAITVTVPAEASVAFPVGAKVDLAQTGAGQVTVAGDSGVTVQTSQTLLLRAQWSGASLVKLAADEWLLVGDLEAA